MKEAALLNKKKKKKVAFLQAVNICALCDLTELLHQIPFTAAPLRTTNPEWVPPAITLRFLPGQVGLSGHLTLGKYYAQLEMAERIKCSDP